MRILPIIALFLLASLSSQGQLSGKIWYFGHNAGLDFGYNPPKALLDGKIRTNEGCASVCNEDGQLLFYTDGSSIYNRKHDTMSNGRNLPGSNTSTQSAIIVPKPGSSNLYYVFTVDNNAEVYGLCYSIVDMDLDDGKGEVTEKNSKIVAPTNERVAAIRHGNGKDFWIVTDIYNTVNINAYLLTDQGLSTSPIVSEEGKMTSTSGDVAGYMRANRTGTRLAIAYYDIGYVDLYKFDKFTGLVSRIGTLGPLNQKLAYGVEFSPNGNFLYASVLGTSGSGDNVIYQFDLRLQGLDEMLSKAYIFNTGDASPGALQLGIDQKIYVALLQKTHLGVIHQPNLPGQKCEYEHSAIDLGVRRSIWGLPTFPNYVMSGPIEIKADHICFGDTAFFRFFTEIPMDSVIWEFSDGTRSTELKPRHYYSEMGEYPILFRGFSGGKEYQQEFWVQVSEYPGLNLGSDREFCDLEPITLKSNSEYPVQWSTGSRDSFIIVDSAGIYWAVANNHGCELRDSVWLYKCNVLVMPNVFSPNGDGLNDVFLPIEMDALQNPHLQIFNRWGELLFETFDLSKGWDGTSNGNPVPGGTYFYVLSFEHPSQGVEYTEGMIELIR